MLISEKYISRIYEVGLVLLAFSIPIYRKVIPYVIAAIVITWFLEADFVVKARRVVENTHRRNTLLFAGLYLIYGFGMLFTGNLDAGLFNLEVKMSLFIFPVLMSTIREDVLTLAIARKVLWAFIFGVLTSIGICYGQAVYHYFQEESLAVFYYSSLSPLIHPSYMAMYVIFAMAAILYFLSRGFVKGRVNRILSVILLIIFEIFVIMLSSKAGILGMVILLIIFPLYLLLAERKILKGLAVSLLLWLSFALLFVSFPVSAERFEETRAAIEQTNINADEIASSSGERLLIWWYSFEITNENLLFGVGTGDVRDELLDKYREKQMYNALGLALNAHNQYLQTTLALGILGLTALLLCIVLPLMYGFEKRHYLLLIFLILVAFNFLFESMLETQAGVVFYAFFNAYLFAIKKDPAS